MNIKYMPGTVVVIGDTQMNKTSKILPVNGVYILESETKTNLNMRRIDNI